MTRYSRLRSALLAVIRQMTVVAASASRFLLLPMEVGCRLRQRQDCRPVGYAIDIAYWCLWRRRQVGFGVDGVADMAQAGSSRVVSSAHHQSVDRLGAGLHAVGCAPDGCVEAIEHT